MRNMLLVCAATAAAAVSFTIPTAAEARQGCGAGFHRANNGRCISNRGYRARGPVMVVGRWYDGRGYWDGRRYWQKRYRYRSGWRYR